MGMTKQDPKIESKAQILKFQSKLRPPQQKSSKDLNSTIDFGSVLKNQIGSKKLGALKTQPKNNDLDKTSKFGDIQNEESKIEEVEEQVSSSSSEAHKN